jgi:hypothetical protein
MKYATGVPQYLLAAIVRLRRKMHSLANTVDNGCHGFTYTKSLQYTECCTPPMIRL